MVVVISGSEVLLGDTLHNIADTKPEPHQGGCSNVTDRHAGR
jgi:hypothetical protein